MTKTMKKAMNTMMTAACAGAAFCCACAASHTVILSVLGAIIMASIIICALVLRSRFFVYLRQTPPVHSS